MISFIVLLLGLGCLLNGIAIIKIAKRLVRLEKSDVYHHTKITFLDSECNKIKEHNQEEWRNKC